MNICGSRKSFHGGVDRVGDLLTERGLLNIVATLIRRRIGSGKRLGGDWGVGFWDFAVRRSGAQGWERLVRCSWPAFVCTAWMVTVSWFGNMEVPRGL